MPSPDSFHLQAAEGWLALGCPADARTELNHIQPSLRKHPDVLDLRWQILAAEKKWEECVDVATAIVRTASSRASGWVRLSYALHEMRLTEDAYDNLLGVVDRFPEEAVIPYNLSCYCCQLGDLDEALDWLKQSMKLGVTDKIRESALVDKDLKPLWKEIREL